LKKSGNVLLTDSEDCKIGDFGLSRALETLGTQTMTAVGTPGWTAPEVLRGEPYAASSDVFSFGVVAWELAARRLPWAGLNAVQIVGRILGDASLLDEPLPGASPALTALLQQLLSADARARPSFAQLVLIFQNE
jgi:serine/threonine protein kinase